MQDFSYTLDSDKPNVTVKVATEVTEPDRVYLSLEAGQISATAGLTLEQAEELRYALHAAFTKNGHLREYHIEDLDEIDAFLEGASDE